MFSSHACWHIPTIPAVRKMKQEDRMFKVSLDYRTIACLKQTKAKTKEGKERKAGRQAEEMLSW